MRYLKTYEGIIKESDAYLRIDDEISKIVSDSLRSLSIYEKNYMQRLIDNVFDDVEIIWTDLKDELNDVLSVGIERCNTKDVAGKNLNGVIFNRLLVLLQTPYKDLSIEEVYSIIDTNKRCEEITGCKSTISGQDPKYYGMSKYSTLGYNYEFNDCINFWKKVRYSTGEERISISLYHQKFGSQIFPIQPETTFKIEEKLIQDLRPKLRELGILTNISHGGSVGASGKKDTIDISFYKLK
jgi:hypothetical protein